MTHLRVGVVGAGSIARRHVGVLGGLTDVDVCGVAAPRAEAAGELAARVGGRAYSSALELVERERPDAVFICVPPDAHGDLELTLIERAIPFFVEKPLAADGETAERIAAALGARPVVTSVGYHWRYVDITARAAALLADRPASLAMGYWLDAVPPPAWWPKHAMSGGQVVEQATHVLDLARLLVGEPVEVTAFAARPPRPDQPLLDIASVEAAALRFAGGAVGTLAATSLAPSLHGAGLLVVSDGMVLEHRGGGELTVDLGDGRQVTNAANDPFLEEDRAFLDAVRGVDASIRSPYADALLTHRVAVAVAEAAASGTGRHRGDNGVWA